MLGQSVRASVICLVPHALLLPITGGSAFADSDFLLYFMCSNLSWNTNDETLRQVRLIVFRRSRP
jgi:hypothetical protein